jgi:ribosomal protein S6--L-glutamate ligase
MKKVGVIGVADGWSSNRLADAVEEKTGFRCLIEMDRLAVDLDTGQASYPGVNWSELDGLIIKKIGSSYSPNMLNRLAMLRFLGERGLPVFSDPFRIKRVLDRLSCTVTLRSAGVAMPPTVITEDVDQAVEAVHRFGKVVLKPMYTSKARGMKVVESSEDVRSAVVSFREAGNTVIYVQKLLMLPGRDLGVAFLGGKFIGCYARRGHGQSWNTTTRAGGKYESHEPTDEVMAVAERAQALFELDFTSVDIAETDEGPMVFEVSAFGGFRGLLHANDIDAASLYADYVLEKLSQ